jgi:hypothetical protein
MIFQEKLQFQYETYGYKERKNILSWPERIKTVLGIKTLHYVLRDKTKKVVSRKLCCVEEKQFIPPQNQRHN